MRLGPLRGGLETRLGLAVDETRATEGWAGDKTRAGRG